VPTWSVAILFLVATACAEVHAGALNLLEEAKVLQSKLQHDGGSLSVFRFLGKTHCLDALTAKKPGDFGTEYGILYNQVYPLPRLLSQESLSASFVALQAGLVSASGQVAKSRNQFADPISACQRLYEVGPRSAKAYRALVNDQKSLHSSEDVDLRKHIQDYLDGYFIKAPL
jgi:hypothetical protein